MLQDFQPNRMTYAHIRGCRTLLHSGLVCLVLASATEARAQDTKVPATKPTTADRATVSPPSSTILVNRIAAVVNTEPILQSKVMERIIRNGGARTQPDSAQLDSLIRITTQDLIDDELLVQRAKIEKVEVNEADLTAAVDGEVKDIRSRFPTEADYIRALKESGFGSIDDFRKDKEDEFRREFLKRDLLAKAKRDGKITPVNVSESDVTAELERSKDVLAKKPAAVGFRQIVFALTPSEASKRRAYLKIDSLRKELELHPQDFESIAKRESQDPGTKELGGDLGWNRRGRMVPEFDRVMFALNPGVISPIVETVFGYHLIRVDRVQQAEVKARHILIKFAIDSTDEKRVIKLADSVATAARAGANFDTLSAHFHDEAGGEERSMPDFTRDSLPVSYHDAIMGHKAGDIVGPFLISDPATGLHKPVVLQLTKVEEVGQYSVTEMRQRIRSNLSDFRGTRRYLDGLRSQAYVWVYEEPKSVAHKSEK
jgi:peptidyl-prolyl cis-trans isomerase SurA